MGYRTLGYIDYRGLQDPRIYITWCYRTLVYKLQWVTGPYDIKLTEGYRTLGYRLDRGLQDPDI